MTVKKGRFKVKGTKILNNGQFPGSMKSFLEDVPEKQTEQSFLDHDGEMHNNSLAHMQKDSTGINSERLHIHVRKDLADKLYSRVFDRKRKSIRTSGKREGATQRAIIEEALEEYFKNHEI